MTGSKEEDEMLSTVNWQNPYAQRAGRWLRGNLHTHTSPASACSAMPLAQVLELYAQAGYDFLAISDHLVYTPATHPRLTLISGMEWNSPKQEHTGIYGKQVVSNPALPAFTSQTELIAALAGTDELLILNHPNWQYRPHYHREELLQAGDYDGVEIFNGVVKRLEGSEYATDKWDYLLAMGKRVLGFASDDAHIVSDIGLGWIMVRAAGNSAGEIFAAIKAGNFYCSSGVQISDIFRNDRCIELETENAQEIQVLGEGGRLIQTTRDSRLTFDLAAAQGSSYVRFTAYGPGAAMAWTQPFFLQ